MKKCIHKINELKIIRPDDFHVHLRDGDILNRVLLDTARQFSRAIIMPNLNPPIITTKQAKSYRKRIIKAIPLGLYFKPLMTLYLTQNMLPDEIVRAKNSRFIYGIKFYPLRSTTNSDEGISDIKKCYKVFEIMQLIGMPLLIHGEIIDDNIDIFDREKIFIERILIPLRHNFPNLKIVFEHITTKDAVDYIKSDNTIPNLIGATITAHHLICNRNLIFLDGLRPHNYCSPIFKREIHRIALINAAILGDKRFFLGTDSAPHLKKIKENSCIKAGCYTASHAIELYAEIFDKAGAINKLEGFASFFGADFYCLPRNNEYITLKKETWFPPKKIMVNNDEIVTFRINDKISWKLV